MRALQCLLFECSLVRCVKGKDVENIRLVELRALASKSMLFWDQFGLAVGEDGMEFWALILWSWWFSCPSSIIKLNELRLFIMDITIWKHHIFSIIIVNDSCFGGSSRFCLGSNQGILHINYLFVCIKPLSLQAFWIEWVACIHSSLRLIIQCQRSWFLSGLRECNLRRSLQSCWSRAVKWNGYLRWKELSWCLTDLVKMSNEVSWFLLTGIYWRVLD